MDETTPTINIDIISDSLGDTAKKLTNSIIAQFPTINFKTRKFVLINTYEELLNALHRSQEADAIIYMTIADPEIAQHAEAFASDAGLICHNLIQPFTAEIEQRANTQASTIQGAQYELSDGYFERIKAIEFTINNDDGKNPQAMEEADIVILGISRTGKTPLSMYLGTLGYKVMNLPLIPEKEVSPLLYDINPQKIVGLTNRPDIICSHRSRRMEEFGLSKETTYTSEKRVKEELKYAHEIYDKIGCPVVNVSERSIEESSTIILSLLNLPMKPRW